MSTETTEQPGPDPEHAPGIRPPDTEDADAPTGRPPRLRRTAVLLCVALVAGALTGAGVGYAIQASRPATPLPPIEVAEPRYPSQPLDAKAAAALAPKPLEIDGDLRKLLVARPKGAKVWDFSDEDGWLAADEMALLFGDPGQQFTGLLQDDFRRAATVNWRQGSTTVRIRLIQYGPFNAGEPDTQVRKVSGCWGFYDSPCAQQDIPGTGSGTAYVTTTSRTFADSHDRYYYGVAVARRGDVLMQIDVYAPRKVPLATVLDLAKRQWEKL